MYVIGMYQHKTFRKTVIYLHQLCALRWMDFEESWKFGTYQFHISRYLSAVGTVKPIIDIKREYYRDVPVAPFLAELLLEYKPAAS